MADQDIDRGKIHKLGSIRVAQLASGLKLDQYELDDALWADGNNITFTSHGVRRASGTEAINTGFPIDLDQHIRGMHVYAARSPGGTSKNYVLFGTETDLYRWDGTTAEVATSTTSITDNYTGGDKTTWSITNLGSIELATNGVDKPQINRNQAQRFDDMVTQGMFDTAEVMLVHGPHVLAFNTDVNEAEVIWSHEDSPEVWAPTLANAAGSFVIREMNGGIKAAVPLGDRIAVYGSSQMFVVTYVGTPFYFGYRAAIEGVGAVSKAAVVSVGRMNYGMSSMGIWQTDGVNHRYIDQPDVSQFLQDNLNTAAQEKVCAYHNEADKQIVWSFPTGASSSAEPSNYLSYHYETGAWSKGTFGFSAATARGPWKNPWVSLSGAPLTETTRLRQVVRTGSSTGSPSIRTVALDLGEPDLIKEITALRIGHQGSGLSFRLGFSNTVGGTITWGSLTPVVEGFEFMPQRACGRYFFLEFSGGGNPPWELSAVDFHGRIGGVR